MWGDGPGGRPNSQFGVKKLFRPARQVTIGSSVVEVQFSPTSNSIPWEQSSNGLIGKTVNIATQSIQMALFVFSDQPLVNLLDAVHQKGADIKALIDPGFAYRPYSEALDMLGITLAEDCRYEPSNRPWQRAIASVGVPRMPPGDLLHHKFGIVDQKIVITGSHNWTAAANTGNDETVLVVHNPTVTAHYQREFERLYTNAILGIPPAIQKKAEAQVRQCQVARSASTAQTQAANRNSAVPQRVPAPSSTAPSNLPRSAANSPSQRVNLNTATQAELEELPGVGPGLAKRIIAARQQKPFSSLADLDRVSGIGPKLLTKLKNRVTW